MLHAKSVALIGAIVALAAAPMASAQEQPGSPAGTSASPPAERVVPGRIGGDRRANRNARREEAPTPPTPEENTAAAQTVATAAGSSCQVNEATLLGVNAEQQSIYEAACASGPGYILIASTPPQAVDCVILAGQADLDRARDPAADVGIQCQLPVNADTAKVVAAYAQEAGIACTVDQGASIGKSPAGNFIYEVGCAEADGFWIEKTAAGWDKTACMQVVTQSGACRFTTASEQATTLKTMLAGSPAASCDVTQARYMGSNANGTFYEAKCTAGDGYIARFGTEGPVQQVYPCAEAQRIGGGCTLTAAAAPATTEPTPAPATE